MDVEGYNVADDFVSPHNITINITIVVNYSFLSHDDVYFHGINCDIIIDVCDAVINESIISDSTVISVKLDLWVLQ